MPKWRNRREYITALRAAIEVMNQCRADWNRTEKVVETCHGGTLWEGRVEVFTLIGHWGATRAYAWAKFVDKQCNEPCFVVVLEIPPVTDAQTAVQASIIADSKSKNR